MERTIRVTGKGKISVSPDTIKLNISAEGVFKDYAETVSKASEETSLIKEAISNAGLDPKDLKTSHFGVDTEYERYRDKRDDWRRKFVGYKYQHRLNIKFPNDNEILGRVLYQLANCPVSVEFSIEHTVKDVEAVKNELLGKAVEDSKAKAEVLSKAAGVKLDGVLTIDYSWGELEIYSRPMEYSGEIMMDSIKCCNIDIEADDIDVQDTVTVVWRIA